MTVSCRCAAVAAFAVLALVAWEGGAHAKIFAQWVQLGPDGTSTVRAITDESCPAVMFDGTPVPMRVRSDPEQPMANVKPAKFPVRGCEIEVPPGAIAAVLDGKVLPLAKRDPQRIMVFGDTGCRLDRAARCRTATSRRRGRFRASPQRRRPRGPISSFTWATIIIARPPAQPPTTAAPTVRGATASTPGMPISSIRRRRCSRRRRGSWFAAITRTAIVPAKASCASSTAIRLNRHAAISPAFSSRGSARSASSSSMVRRRQIRAAT